MANIRLKISELCQQYHKAHWQWTRICSLQYTNKRGNSKIMARSKYKNSFWKACGLPYSWQCFI